jgi:hypothetical protein
MELNYFQSLYTPHIIEKKELNSFFFDPSFPLYQSYEENYITNFNQINVEEWETYFDKKITKVQLEYWLYKSDLKQIDDQIFNIRDGKALPNTFNKNHNLNSLSSKEKTIPFLFYLGFALRNEKFSTKQIHSWEEEKVKYPEVNITSQIIGGIGLLNSEKNNFIKERYLFQLIRLYFYNNQFDEAIQIYEKNKSEFKTKNSIEQRILGYIAASYKKKGDYSQANLLYSRIFEKSPTLKKSAFLSFHIQNDKEWKKTISLAKTDSEKLALWYIYGVRFNGLQALKEIYSIQKDSEYLDSLLTREINKKEYDFIEWRENKKEDNKTFITELKELIQFTNKVAEERPTSFIWNISAAYLNFASKNFPKAESYLVKSEKESSKKKIYTAQYHLTHLFGKIISKQKIDNSLDQEILPDLEFIFSKNAESIKDFRYEYARVWVRSILAHKLAKQNEIEKSEMIKPKTTENHFSKIESTQKMISYLNSGKFSKLENFFLKRSSISPIEYIRHLGSQYLYKDDLDSALKTFKQIPKENLKMIQTDPFKIKNKDCLSCDILKKPIYNEISLVEKMIEIKKQISQNKNVPENYTLLGNVFYNLSYFGTSKFYTNQVHSFGVYSWLDTYSISYYKPNKKIHTELDINPAIRYYQLAIETTTDKEIKARNTFYSAKCELNEWYLNKPENSEQHYKIGSYLKSLKENYKDTNYYKEILGECGYFSKFVGK